jgi:predicted DsbA family dithiol-disulfide isomerase
LAADAPHDIGDGQSPIVARAGDRVIREAEVDRYIGREVYALQQRLYSLRQQAIKNIIDSILLRQEAEVKHITDAELLDRVAGSVRPPTAVDVERGWSENYDALKPLGDAIGRYRVALDSEDHARTEAVQSYLEMLEKRAGVVIDLKPPEFRLQAARSSSRLGATDAHNVLTVFLDYECPYCIKLEALLQNLLQEEPTRSHLTIDVKQLPLSIHRTAFESALAATCAAEQGKFAIVHDRLFSQSDHSPSGISEIAQSAGLNLSEFQTCFDAEAAKRRVLSDMREARVNGIQGTPALFLNGVPLAGGENGDLIRKSILSELQSRGAAETAPGDRHQ